MNHENNSLYKKGKNVFLHIVIESKPSDVVLLFSYVRGFVCLRLLVQFILMIGFHFVQIFFNLFWGKTIFQ